MSAVRPATVRDLPEVVGLLEAAALPTKELGRTTVWIAEDGEEVCGIAGLQALQEDGLLRSVTVESSRRGQLIGRQLVDHVIQEARRRRLRAVYALAEGQAATWLTRRGFVPTERSAAPAAVTETALYREACGPETPLLRFDLAT